MISKGATAARASGLAVRDGRSREALSEARLVIPKTYRELFRLVKQTFDLGRQRIEEEKIRRYWQAGWYINAHIRIKGARAEYGKRVMEKLSTKLGLGYTILHRCAEFQEKFPGLKILAARQELPGEARKIEKKGRSNGLTWTHYRILLTVTDDRQRFYFHDRALRHGWTAAELERRIRRSRARAALSGASEKEKRQPKLLVPKRGKLSHYRISEDRGQLVMDYGFTFYEDLTEEEGAGFKVGDIVWRVPDKAMKKLPEAKPEDLYTYRAEVLNWIDADTPWMKIYLYGRRWVKQRLRLRGLDAPERSTPKGRAAKRFVEAETARAKGVVITTTKPDKYDRYLSDVFLIREDGKEIFLNNLLLEKGFARLKHTFTDADWIWVD